MRHYHKRYGALNEESGDAVDAVPRQSLKVPSGTGSISSYQSAPRRDPDLVRTLSRRESVATMAWKRMKKMKEDTGVNFFFLMLPCFGFIVNFQTCDK